MNNHWHQDEVRYPWFASHRAGFPCFLLPGIYVGLRELPEQLSFSPSMKIDDTHLIFVRKHQARTNRTKSRARTSKIIATCRKKVWNLALLRLLARLSDCYCYCYCQIVIDTPPSLHSFRPPPLAPFLCSVFSKCPTTGTANGSAEHEIRIFE